MRITELRCDRCGSTISTNFPPMRLTTQPSDGYRVTASASKQYDLCSGCLKKLNRFLNNQDQVGDEVFELVDGPCPHSIPCAGACTSVWEPRKRK